MKETTKMSRAVGQLEKIYNTLNADLFNGALPVPIITVQSKAGTYGHCTTSKVWRNKDSEQYEMNIAAEMLNMEIEEVLDTLIHEIVHLYCRENGIQEVSRGGKYHNGKFKALAEEKGLICYKAGQYGWNTRGHDNDKLLNTPLKKDGQRSESAEAEHNGCAYQPEERRAAAQQSRQKAENGQAAHENIYVRAAKIVLEQQKR